MGGGLQVNIVSVHVLYVGFMPVYVGRDGLSGTPVYVSVCQFTLVGRDVELDNINCLLRVPQKNASVAHYNSKVIMHVYWDIL